MKKLELVLIICMLIAPLIVKSQNYKTQPLSSEIKTISVNKNGDWLQPPFINLHSGDFIRINFDRLGENSFNRLRYKLVHCNADWTPSTLSYIEYLDGFNDNYIEDYASSVNTTVEYTNFGINIPNQDLSLKVSGNYAVIVYEEDNQDNILLNACFSVIDNVISISGGMSSNTLIDSHKEHHQISFIINHQNISIKDPLEELKVFVRQNNRLDNQKVLVKPTYIQPNRLVYEQNKDLIFEAGNEYRRFESVSYRYNGLNIDRTEYVRPYNYTYIIPDQIRAYKRYIYDQDQNGRFYIRNAEASDNDIDADYFYTKFSLSAEDPILNRIYVTGDFCYNIFGEDNLMQYDYEQKEYYTTILLKQGAYNYLYLAQDGDKYSTAPMEGNYYETENEYQIFVYYRPIGERSDKLIGFLNIAK
ncbi:DUF5103 domain-containing protein [Dysgonomonas sp. 216]|uniref:type IX secretion system plug protein n=1 Tax=Dysgonomonas sp. 216 TaxID=2302934 RepID=UPI0013D457A0|nr:DUF5103 domain-containing protein [Dysgonomonas sp. 216]NDW17903.1 DUF5103 domain-containing protein [Dysgonomonas sp. 216]